MNTHEKARERTSVLFGLGASVAAIETEWISRVLLPEDVPGVGERLAPSVLTIQGTPHVAWDLSALTDVATDVGGWILLRVPFETQFIPLALRTGRCLAVVKISDVVPLPRAIFKSRPRAFEGAFVVPKLSRSQGEGVGLFIDPRHLWTPAELERSRSALASAAQAADKNAKRAAQRSTSSRDRSGP